MTETTQDQLTEPELLFINSDLDKKGGSVYLEPYKLIFHYKYDMNRLVYEVEGSPIDLRKKITRDGKAVEQHRSGNKSTCGPFVVVEAKQKAAAEPVEEAKAPAPKKAPARRGRPKSK